MNATRAALRLAPSILVLALIGAWGLQTAPAAPAKDPTQLEAITAEQATELVRQSADLVKQGKPLRLAVKELSADVATILAGSQAELHLPTLTSLTPDAAAGLAPFAGTLALGVKELSDEAAAALAKRAGITRLDALTTLTSLPLAERIGKQTVVSLGGVRRISPEIARALNPPVDLQDKNLGYRWIDIGLTELSPEAGAAFVASRHGFIRAEGTTAGGGGGVWVGELPANQTKSDDRKTSCFRGQIEDSTNGGMKLRKTQGQGKG